MKSKLLGKAAVRSAAETLPSADASPSGDCPGAHCSHRLRGLRHVHSWAAQLVPTRGSRGHSRGGRCLSCHNTQDPRHSHYDLAGTYVSDGYQSGELNLTRVS